MGRIQEALKDAVGKSGWNHGVECQRETHPRTSSKAGERFSGGLSAAFQIIMPHFVDADIDNGINKLSVRSSVADIGSDAVLAVGLASGQPEIFAAGVVAKAAYNVAVGLRRHSGEQQPPAQASDSRNEQHQQDSENTGNRQEHVLFQRDLQPSKA